MVCGLPSAIQHAHLPIIEMINNLTSIICHLNLDLRNSLHLQLKKNAASLKDMAWHLPEGEASATDFTCTICTAF